MRGSIGASADLICGTFGRARSRPPLTPYLHASTSNHYLAEGFLAFAASRTADKAGQVEFTAETQEHVEGLSIRRFVTEMAPRSSFAVRPHLRGATVTPPPPFSGTASFGRRSDGVPASWSGSLSVSFPGKPDVPLTGPDFRFLALGLSRF